MNNTQVFQKQEKITRWDKAKKNKESERINKQPAGFTIRISRSRTIVNISNNVSLVIKDPKEIKGLQNKRKKFGKTFEIPKDITLQGETIYGEIRNIETCKITTWTPLNIPKKGQMKTSISMDDKGEDIDPGAQDMINNQEIEYMSSHEPPDPKPTTKVTREEYDEVFHDMDSMETDLAISNRAEFRNAQLANELSRININSNYREVEIIGETPVQQLITQKLSESR
ncbi:hypothetical protein K7X08_019871 [Anisodus acutangulus]|uniref:Uncharacterized protein n=1 Tax=Anisodus acutangulus TaxID=402998 RepID=A0A9Q1MW20_9SOLA|nr:hypothetical protein K7X08_019871 [Anisodus acutangulus]